MSNNNNNNNNEKKSLDLKTNITALPQWIFKFFDRAIKAVPETKYALGGIVFAVIGFIVFTVFSDRIFLALFGTFIGFILTILVILIVQLVNLDEKYKKFFLIAILALIYSTTGLTISFGVLLLTSFFINQPIPRIELLEILTLSKDPPNGPERPDNELICSEHFEEILKERIIDPVEAERGTRDIPLIPDNQLEQLKTNPLVIPFTDNDIPIGVIQLSYFTSNKPFKITKSIDADCNESYVDKKTFKGLEEVKISFKDNNYILRLNLHESGQIRINNFYKE